MSIFNKCSACPEGIFFIHAKVLCSLEVLTTDDYLDLMRLEDKKTSRIIAFSFFFNPVQPHLRPQTPPGVLLTSPASLLHLKFFGCTGPSSPLHKGFLMSSHVEPGTSTLRFSAQATHYRGFCCRTQASIVAAHGIGCSHSMWNFPGPGIEPCIGKQILFHCTTRETGVSLLHTFLLKASPPGWRSFLSSVPGTVHAAY